MTTPKFLIDPHKGVGPIRFGMTRPEVTRTMKEEPFTRDGRKEGFELSDYFQGRSVQVIFDPNELVGGVQFFGLDEVVYPPDVRMDRPYRGILRWAREQDPELLLESDGFRSKLLGLVVGVRDNDPADAKQKLRLVLVHRPRFYEDVNEWIAAFRAKKKKKK